MKPGALAAVSALASLLSPSEPVPGVVRALGLLLAAVGQRSHVAAEFSVSSVTFLALSAMTAACFHLREDADEALGRVLLWAALVEKGSPSCPV